MYLNPLLPVLHILDSEQLWPATLDDPDIGVLHVATRRLAGRARELAVSAGNAAAPADGIATPHSRADAHLVRWAGAAGHDARKILRAALVPPTGEPGGVLLDAVTAALTLRGGEAALGRSGERHDKSLLNRALAAAEWVGASRRPERITFDSAARVFTEQLPGIWRWDTRPSASSGGDAGADAATGEAGARRFSVVRDRPRRGGQERITVTGYHAGRVQIVHEVTAGADHQPAGPYLTWAELCQHMARTCARTPGAAVPSAAAHT